MTRATHRPIPKLRNAPQPPLSHAGAIPDSDRAKRPPLSEPSATGQELSPGDRVEGLGKVGRRRSHEDPPTFAQEGLGGRTTVVGIRELDQLEKRNLHFRAKLDSFKRASSATLWP
jgi:hypothetical protein